MPAPIMPAFPEVSNPDLYFDKLAFRIKRKLTTRQDRYLRANAKSLDVRTGRPISNSEEFAKHKLILSVILPNRHALEFLAKQSGFKTNYVEAALDIPVKSAEAAQQLHEYFDQHFVHSRHGKHETRLHINVTYTGQHRAGHRYVWYGDKPGKRTNTYCLHIEGRHQGMQECKRIGISEVRDLLKFDHARYWSTNLNLMNIDLEKLGCFHSNKVANRRRRKTKVGLHGVHSVTRQQRRWVRIKHYGMYSYNFDQRAGATLFHVLAVHEDQMYRSLQRFIDVYGKGHYLSKVDITSLGK